MYTSGRYTGFIQPIVFAFIFCVVYSFASPNRHRLLEKQMIWHLRGDTKLSLMMKLKRNIMKLHHNQHLKTQSAFKDACKELKRIGKGVVKSYPEIENAGTCSLCIKIV